MVVMESEETRTEIYEAAWASAAAAISCLFDMLILSLVLRSFAERMTEERELRFLKTIWSGSLPSYS